jgi:pyruvate dehydrogenase E2 component (dihydrolipoamide acetyltransferase)
MADPNAPYEVVMPRMGLTMEEGTVVAWLKAVGEPVKSGEPLVEIETDKATMEIESPRDGVLSQVLAQPGTTLPIGAPIAYLSPPGAVLPIAPDQPASSESKVAPTSGTMPLRSPAPSLPGSPSKVRASPAARRLAAQKGIDLIGVPGSGPGGRVVAWNVAEAAQALTAQAAPATPVAQRLAQDLGVDLAYVQGSGPGGRITRQDVERSAVAKDAGRPAIALLAVSAEFPEAPVQPLSRFQKIMAERMASSFRDAPHFYLHVEADARPLLALRQALLPKLEARHGLHLTVTDLLVKFCALALARHPHVIAQWTAKGLLQPGQINIGVAADTPNGLVVPVIRQCDQLGLSEIARLRAALVEKARLGKLAPEDLELGVFTLTNLGAFNVDFFDAVLNPPQAAILAVGRIKERPLVENGQVVAAPTLQLSLSIDHRVLDGAAAARFLSDLVELIETPGLALG